MSGSDIKLVLEQALDRTFNGGSTGEYPYAAGLRYDVDANGDLGSRISNLECNIRLAGEWSAIDMMATYVVVTNDFIATGKDGYAAFADVENVVDTQTAYAQTFIDYAIDKGTLLDPSLDTYSTQSYIPVMDEEDVATGLPMGAPMTTPTTAPTNAAITDDAYYSDDPTGRSRPFFWGAVVVLFVSTLLIGARINS
jgi:5'-nucleotidase, C-terminal domain